MVSWDRVHQLIESVESVSKTTDKLKKVQQFDDLQDLFCMIMDKKNTTGVTKSGIQKFLKVTFGKYNFKGSTEKYENDVLALLNDLVSRKLTGHDAKHVISHLLQENPDFNEAIFRVATGNLKLRIQGKQLNKIFPGLIPEFCVSLAKDFAKHNDYFIETAGQGWFASRKFDGVRCLTVVTPGNVTCFSRVGNPFPSLSNLENYFKKYNSESSFVLDGEICIVNDGVEDFSSTVSQIKRKSKKMECINYYCFDMISLDVFYNRTESTLKFSQRQKQLSEFIGQLGSDEHISVFHVRQTQVDSNEHLNQLMDDAMDNSYEGLILRKNELYEGKRTKNLLKVKKFQCEEFVVEEVQFSDMQIVDPETKKPVMIKTLQSVGIRHKGHIVFVGSGFSVEERQRYWEHPEDIMGHTISVQYFEESQDSKGTPSLRFPTVKAVYDLTRDF